MNRRILAVVVALVLALGGGALVISYARNADARAIASESPTLIWVTQQPVPAGTTLKDAQRTGLISQTSVAAKAVPAGALQDLNADNNALLAVSDIGPGEVLLNARFGSQPVGVKAIVVPSGMLAVSVALSDPARVGKFVTPGSHIALYQSYKMKDLRNTPEAKIFNENDIHGTSLLLGDVLVIGMGDSPLVAGGTQAKADDQAQGAQDAAGQFLVTVAVKPADAPTLVHGVTNRTLYAALRGSDVKVDPALGVTDITMARPVSAP
jgi:pilus assembly protein CpaB